MYDFEVVSGRERQRRPSEEANQGQLPLDQGELVRELALLRTVLKGVVHAHPYNGHMAESALMRAVGAHNFTPREGLDPVAQRVFDTIQLGRRRRDVTNG